VLSCPLGTISSKGHCVASSTQSGQKVHQHLKKGYKHPRIHVNLGTSAHKDTMLLTWGMKQLEGRTLSLFLYDGNNEFQMLASSIVAESQPFTINLKNLKPGRKYRVKVFDVHEPLIFGFSKHFKIEDSP